MMDALHIVTPSNLPWVRVPGVPGSIKLLHFDEARGRAVVFYRFEPGEPLPRHEHACRAVALTLEGAWDYDEGPLSTGDLAIEEIGAVHTARSGLGSTLFIVFDSPDGVFLHNEMPDGSIVTFDSAFFQDVKRRADEQILARNAA